MIPADAWEPVNATAAPAPQRPVIPADAWEPVEAVQAPPGGAPGRSRSHGPGGCLGAGPGSASRASIASPASRAAGTLAAGGNPDALHREPVDGRRRPGDRMGSAPVWPRVWSIPYRKGANWPGAMRFPIRTSRRPWSARSWARWATGLARRLSPRQASSLAPVSAPPPEDRRARSRGAPSAASRQASPCP